MHSKKLMTLILSGSVVFALAFSLSGCDAFLRGKSQPPDQPIRVKPKEFECMKIWPEKANKFLSDQASVEETDFLFQCLTTSLTAFGSLTKGTDASVYTAEELRYYFNRFLLRQNQISPEFMIQIMKLKNFVVGGPSTSLTREELKTAIQFIQTVGVETQKVHGQMKFFFFKQSPESVSLQKIEEAAGIFEQVFLNMIKNTQAQQSSYEFADFKNFIAELGKFLGDNNSFSQAQQWMPMVEALKNLFLGVHMSLQSNFEWNRVVEWVNKLYFLALKTHYQLLPFQFENPSDSGKLIAIIDHGFTLMETAPQLQERGLFEVKDIDALIDRVWELPQVQMNLEPDMVKLTYKRLLSNVIDGNRNAQVFEVRGLNARHFNVLKHEYQVWKLIQLANNSAFSQGNSLLMSEYIQKLSPFNIQSSLDEMKIPQEERALFVDAWKNWQSLIKMEPPLRLTAQTQLWIENTKTPGTIEYKGVTWTAVFNSISRLLLRGYGNGVSRSLFANQITKERLMDFETDFREIGVSMGLLNPGRKSSAEHAFVEANMLTPHGDGNQLLSSTELMEILHMMMSAGRSLTLKIHQDIQLQNECRAAGLDILGKPFMKAECLKSYVRTHYADLFSTLPGLKKFMEKQSAKEFDEFYESLMVVAREPDAATATFDYLTVRNSMMVLHYLEVLITTFDKDRNNILDEAELRFAYPRFQDFILGRKEMKDQDPEWGVWAFLYIAENGDIPSTWDLIRDRYLPDMPWTKKIAIDRKQLLRVLAILKKSS